MFFFRTSVVLMVFTNFFQNGGMVKVKFDSSSQPSDNKAIVVQYNNLLDIDTGYSNDDMKKTREEITESALKEANKKVYERLMCSYVFTCRQYLVLLKSLVYTTGKFMLETVPGEDDDDSYGIRAPQGGILEMTFRFDWIQATGFQDQIVKMFFVLKHLGGTANGLDPLWLMYVYVDCLRTVTSETDSLENITNTTLIRSDHDDVYRSLTRFADNNCRPENVFNDQNSGSNFYRKLSKFNFNAKDADMEMLKLFTEVIETTEDRNAKTSQILGVDNALSSFNIGDMRLSHIVHEEEVMTILLDDFAEVKHTEPSAYERIQRHCSIDRRGIVTVRSLVADVGGCQVIFVDLIKYIVARNTLKYVLDVRETLSSSYSGGQSSPEELTSRINRSNLDKTNETMLGYYKDIIVGYLRIDEDDELRFVSQILSSDPRVTFGDLTKNADNENRILNMLDTLSKGLHLFPVEIPDEPLDPSNKSQRKAAVYDLAERFGVNLGDSKQNEYEGMLDLFVLKSYIAKLFVGTDLDIARSFFEFQRNYLGD